MWTEYLGIIGMVLIILAWMPQTINVIKNKRSQIPRLFSAIYSLASLLLTLYAVSINDFIFTTLNALAFFQSAISFKYARE